MIVTGAVGGLGSALMSALEELDCRVVGIDLPTAVESGADPNRLIGADLADADSAHAAVGAAVDRLGGPDCLVGAAAAPTEIVSPPGQVLVGHQACLGHGGGHTT